ncbi:MAG: alanine--tRNA ligase-related protein [Promethearchaeota archaeon]
MKTKKLYWERPSETEFEAELVEIRDGALVLDKTLFYPGGGGQACDRGLLKITEMELEVTGVTRDGDVILHHVGNYHGNLEVGDEVRGEINWSRRHALMKAHTGQHVFSGILKNTRGIETTSVLINPGMFSIELSREIVDGTLFDLMVSINRFCTSFHDVKSIILPRCDAISLYQERVRGAFSNEDPVRIIDIDDLEVACCGGVHVENAVEVGPIFVTRLKNGTSIRCVVGDGAISEICRVNSGILKLAERVHQDHSLVIETALNNWSSLKAMKGDVKRLGDRLLEFLSTRPEVTINGHAISVVEISLNKKMVAAKFKKFPWNSILIIINAPGKFMVYSSSKKATAKDIADMMLEKYGGKGGGNLNIAQGMLDAEPAREEILQTLRMYLED